MTALSVALLSLAIGLAGVLFAWSYPHGVRRMTSLEPAAWRARLLRTEARLRPLLVYEAAPVGSWERELAAELLEAGDDRERMLAVNDSLQGLEHALRAREDWPRAALWISAAAWGLASVVAWLSGAGIAVLAGVPIELATVFTCYTAQRAGLRRAKMQRRALDELVAALVGELYCAELALPTRRRKGRRR